VAQLDQLRELLGSEVWRMLEHRLNQEAQRAQDQAMAHLNKGEYRESHQALGLVQAFRICQSLPAQMAKEMENKGE